MYHSRKMKIIFNVLLFLLLPILSAYPDGKGKVLGKTRLKSLHEIAYSNSYNTSCWSPVYISKYRDSQSDEEIESRMRSYDLVLKEIIKEFPDDPKAYLHYAETRMVRKEYREAEKFYRLAGSSEQALFGVADALFGQGRTNEAVRVLEELNEKHPKTLGRVYSMSHRYADLAAWALKILKAKCPMNALSLPRQSSFRAYPEAKKAVYENRFTKVESFSLKVKGISREDARIRFFSNKMKSFGFGFSDDAKYALEVELSDDAPVNEKEGYFLQTSSKGATVKARDSQGVLWGLVTLIQIANRVDKSIREATVYDWPDLNRRGYFGYYWPDAAEFTVMFKMNSVVLQRHPEFLGQFTPLRTFLNESLAKEFSSLGLDLFFGSMWLSMDPQMPMGRSRTINYRTDIFKHYAKWGANVYWPLDDIRFPLLKADLDEFGAGANIDAKHLNAIYRNVKKDYPSFKVVFCPPFYWGPDGQGWRRYPEAQQPYLESISKDLDPEIMVVWSGPRVKGYKKEKHKVAWFSNLIGRKPLVIQNGSAPHNLLSYIVDETDWNRWWHYDGFYGDIESYMKNSNTPEECPQLTTLADCLWNDRAYEPKRSIREGVTMLMGGGVFDVLNEALADLTYFDKYKYGNVKSTAEVFNALSKENYKELERRYKHAKACWEKAMKLSPAECAVYGAYGRGVKFAEKVFNERRKFPEDE